MLVSATQKGHSKVTRVKLHLALYQFHQFHEFHEFDDFRKLQKTHQIHVSGENRVNH